MATSSTTPAAYSDVLIPTVVSKIKALCTNAGMTKYSKQALPPLPEDKPPLRSQAHIAAATKYGTDNSFYQATYATSTPEVRLTAERGLSFQKDNLKQLKENDAALAKEYDQAQENVKTYIAICTEASVILGSLGPKGAHKDKLFGGLRTELGPDADTQVPLHEVLASLESLKTTVHKVEIDEMYKMIVDAMPAKTGIHKGSGTDFTKYYNDLCALRLLFEAGAPITAPGVPAEEIILTTKNIRRLLMSFIDYGDHGARVRAQLATIAAPADSTVAALNKWYLSASAVVDEEAGKSTVDKTVLKVAAQVVKETDKRTARPPPLGLTQQQDVARGSQQHVQVVLLPTIGHGQDMPLAALQGWVSPRPRVPPGGAGRQSS